MYGRWEGNLLEVTTLRPRACRLVTLAAVALSTAACGSGRGPSGASPFNDGEAPTTIQIQVRNLNFLDARLFAIRRGSRVRIGSITGKTDELFTLRWPFTDPLAIEIDLVGGGKCTTRSLMTDPGDLIELQIEGRLSRSCRRGSD